MIGSGGEQETEGLGDCFVAFDPVGEYLERD